MTSTWQNSAGSATMRQVQLTVGWPLKGGANRQSWEIPAKFYDWFWLQAARQRCVGRPIQLMAEGPLNALNYVSCVFQSINLHGLTQISMD